MGSDSHGQSNMQTRLSFLKFGNPCLNPDDLWERGNELNVLESGLSAANAQHDNDTDEGNQPMHMRATYFRNIWQPMAMTCTLLGYAWACRCPKLVVHDTLHSKTWFSCVGTAPSCIHHFDRCCYNERS